MGLDLAWTLETLRNGVHSVRTWLPIRYCRTTTIKYSHMLLIIIIFTSLAVRKHAMQPCLNKTTIYLLSIISFTILVYGITGNALDWFKSYLTGRIQRVVIEDSVSVDHELDFGVPQGSVLGPRIYCMYTKPVSDIIQRHGLSHHSYADDTQLYMTMDHSNNDWRIV